jgi:hypothetical protein
MIGGLPNVSGALGAWSQQIIFLVVEKTLVNGLIQETYTSANTLGVVMPLKPQQLSMKPEGERAWKWRKMFCLPTPSLVPSDEIIFGTDENGERFRVMAKADFSEYGYNEYEICQGYQIT